MPKHKYRSRARYIYYRKKKEYNRYVKKFKEIEEKLKKKGLSMNTIGVLSFDAYFSAIGDMKLVSKNPMRDLLQIQAYKFSYQQTIALKKHFSEIQDEEMKKKYQKLTLAQIRSGKGYDLSFLSDIWKKYKEQYRADKGGTYKEAFAEFEKEWFGYAQ